MTRFTVKWLNELEGPLAAYWLQSTDKKAFTKSQYRIDHLLESNPHGHGRHLSEGLWKIVELPLVAYYEINELDRLVCVTDFNIIEQT